MSLGILFIILIAIYEIYQSNSFRGSHIDFSKSIDTTPSKDPKLVNFLGLKHKYLKSDQWFYKRAEVIKRDRWQCRSCNSSCNLQVHHLKDYNLIPNEPTSSLVTLCNKCHQYQHDQLGYPQTYQDCLNWDVSLIRKPQ